MNLNEADAAAGAGAVAPRVSLAEIEAAISARYDFTADQAAAALDMPPIEPLKVLSVCILVLENGFTVIGKSAPASPANFKADLGRQFAYDDAIRQLWPLMGFCLREQLYRGYVAPTRA